jgi:hypothetical protein
VVGDGTFISGFVEHPLTLGPLIMKFFDGHFYKRLFHLRAISYKHLDAVPYLQIRRFVAVVRASPRHLSDTIMHYCS